MKNESVKNPLKFIVAPFSDPVMSRLSQTHASLSEAVAITLKNVGATNQARSEEEARPNQAPFQDRLCKGLVTATCTLQEEVWTLFLQRAVTDAIETLVELAPTTKVERLYSYVSDETVLGIFKVNYACLTELVRTGILLLAYTWQLRKREIKLHELGDLPHKTFPKALVKALNLSDADANRAVDAQRVIDANFRYAKHWIASLPSLSNCTISIYSTMTALLAHHAYGQEQVSMSSWQGYWSSDIERLESLGWQYEVKEHPFISAGIPDYLITRMPAFRLP